MHRIAIAGISALAAWATGAAARPSVCPLGIEWVDDVQKELAPRLSDDAEIYLPGTGEFVDASTRWSVLEQPEVNVVVVPGNAEDVAETVKFSNKKHVPFLTYNGRHGALTTLGKMDYGVEIFLEKLNSVEIAEDGKTVKVGGGTNSKVLIDALWEAGKQAVTGTCECVSYLGPALGGGHGWLQGHHGLIGDQFVSLDIVLADGTLKTLTPKSDLFWAMNGAGHNFGIVTSVTARIFDIEHIDWAIETITYSGDKVEAVYEAANEHLVKDGKHRVDIINWSYWMNVPDADPEKPVIIFYILQEGVKAVDPTITKPFHDIGPLSIEPQSGTYLDASAWTGISNDAPPCQKAGLANPRFPAYIEKYNATAQSKAYDLFAAEAGPSTPFFNSIFMFEGYSQQGVKAIDAKSTAFAYRGDNILAAPLVSYNSTDAAIDEKAGALGVQLREILRDGSGRAELHSYVNYAFGDETPAEWYGAENWRQKKLKALKEKYDPEGKFSFYAPIV